MENKLIGIAYLIELFPYSVRTRGIGIEQVFGKVGAFFSNNVNPIALTALDWKFLAIYCGWITFECLFVWFLYPETQGRTLEELAFCEYLLTFLFFNFFGERGRREGRNVAWSAG